MQILLNSIISGLLLSIVAIGFNLVFNATKVFHLAHGALYVTAIYAVYALVGLFDLGGGWVFVPAILGSFLIVVLLSALIEILVYRPLYYRNANPTISMVSSLGVYFIIVNCLAFQFGNESIALNNAYSIITTNEYFSLTVVELIQVLTASLILTAIYLFSRTYYFDRIRAITNSYVVSEKFGISVRGTRLLAVAVGTFLAAAAAILKGLEVAVDPYSGLSVALTASIAAIIGGSRSLKGTVIASFVIAMIQNYSVLLVSAQWKETLTYLLLLGVLLFYRRGLVFIEHRRELR